MKKMKMNGGSAAAIALLLTGLSIGIASPMGTPIFVEDETVSIEAKNEILWLARAVYSETKIEKEQELVAWVVRNRVESNSFPDSYKRVVLQHKQFSGLHPSDAQYGVNIVRDYGEKGSGWDTALVIAQKVYNAPNSARLLPSGVFHFYSPKSVRRTPSWAEGIDPVHVVRNPSGGPARFAFYDIAK